MNSTIDAKQFFDELATTWKNNDYEYTIREKITQLIKLPKNSLIADIGCGKGVMFEHLLKTAPREILAIDISGEMIKYAQQTFNDQCITYINEDLFAASLPMLDAALFFNAYPHFMDKALLAKKLARHVSPEGCIVIAHSCSKEKINNIHKHRHAVNFSVPLRSASEEVKEFQPYFSPDTIIDNEDIYFIKLIRSHIKLSH